MISTPKCFLCGPNCEAIDRFALFCFVLPDRKKSALLSILSFFILPCSRHLFVLSFFFVRCAFPAGPQSCLLSAVNRRPAHCLQQSTSSHINPHRAADASASSSSAFFSSFSILHTPPSICLRIVTASHSSISIITHINKTYIPLLSTSVCSRLC